MIMIKLFAAFCFILLFVACKYNNEEMLYGNKCDTSNVKYSVQIIATLTANCTVCHTGTFALGSVRLDTYTHVRTVALNGRLLGAVSHAPGFTPMPYLSTKLSECRIAEIRTWIKEGALNN